MTLSLIDEAVASGARMTKACEVLGLSERTVERWRTEEHGGRDGRAGPHRRPAHELYPVHEDRRRHLTSRAHAAAHG